MRKMKTNRKASKLDKLKALVAVLETEVKELDEALEADQLDQEKPETKVTFRHLPCLRYLGADHGTVGELPESHSRPGHVAHSYFTYSNRDWARPPWQTILGVVFASGRCFAAHAHQHPMREMKFPRWTQTRGASTFRHQGRLKDANRIATKSHGAWDPSGWRDYDSGCTASCTLAAECARIRRIKPAERFSTC
jgi:hypothetical protein